jgi:hypothetical protein
MVNYLTLLLCCISSFILGGTAVAVWRILTEKGPIEQLKGAHRDQYNVTDYSAYARSTSNKLTGSCPVDNCNIRGSHSHAEALISRFKEK